MARNKRRTVKDKEKVKKIRKEARKRWRQKKSAEKAMKKLAEEKKRNEDKERRKFKEIDPSLVVRTTKFLGAGTFGSCYLAFYRDMVVAVKEFKERKNADLAHLRSEVHNEVTMIKHLKDHRGVPLLFGIITKSELIRLVTKFHGNKNKGLTLHKAIKKETLEKPTWLEIGELVSRQIPSRRCPCPPINRRSIENSIHTLPPKLSTGVAGRVPNLTYFL